MTHIYLKYIGNAEAAKLCFATLITKTNFSFLIFFTHTAAVLRSKTTSKPRLALLQT